MKKLITSVLLTAALLAPAASAVADTSVATINMRQIFKQLPQRQAVAKKLQQKFAPQVKELKSLESQMKGLYNKQKKNAGLMSDEQKTKLQRKLEELQADFRLKRKNYQADRQQAGQKAQRELIGKIQTAVEKIAKKKHLDLVVPIDATAYAKSNLDISKQVIEAISKN